MKRKRAITIRRRWSAAVFAFLLLSNATTWTIAQSPYATELIAQNGAYGVVSFYNDPSAVLGEPTRIASDSPAGGNPYHISVVQAAQNRDLAGNNILTTFSRTSNGAGGFTYGSITAKFDHPILDDPTNPYGVDLNVFGNAFYVGSGFASDSTDMRTYNLMGSSFPQPVVISVSPDNINWYTYASGPYGDTSFPTQGYNWSGAQRDATGNGWTTTTDFTKPVNPTLTSILESSTMLAADAMSTYLNSGGGTGIDLAASGFASIQYVRVEATAQFRDGEIDGFADVRPAVIGEALSITPDNVAVGTKLYFQNASTTSHTAVVATFTAVSGLARLATAPVVDPTTLTALPSGNLLASYELNLSPLIGNDPIDITTNYELSPGPTYAGNGSGLELLSWNGSTWQSITHTFDTLTKRLTVSNWTDSSTAFSILDTATLAGDFNHDGHVDAADYIAGRKALGSSYFPEQYAFWRTNFGKSQGSGVSYGVGASTIPEPTTFALVVFGIIVILREPRRPKDLR